MAAPGDSRVVKRHAATFLSVARELLESGHAVQFPAEGTSMVPIIRHGDVITVGPIDPAAVAAGDIVLSQDHGRPIVHRVAEVRTGARGAVVVLRGDAKPSWDAAVGLPSVLGKVLSITRRQPGYWAESWRRIVTLLSH